MSDLISRSEVLSFIQKIKDEINDNKCFGDKSRKLNMGDLQDIILFVENVSTAYSVDKVVEELEEVAYVDGDVNSFVDLEDATEIVNQGDVSDDVCEVELLRGYKFLHETSCGNVFDMQKGFKYCPYCGKKIKVE